MYACVCVCVCECVFIFVKLFVSWRVLVKRCLNIDYIANLREKSDFDFEIFSSLPFCSLTECPHIDGVTRHCDLLHLFVFGHSSLR